LSHDASPFLFDNIRTDWRTNDFSSKTIDFTQSICRSIMFKKRTFRGKTHHMKTKGLNIFVLL